MNLVLCKSLKIIQKCKCSRIVYPNNRCYGKVTDSIDYLSEETSADSSMQKIKDQQNVADQYKAYMKLPFEKNTGVINNILYGNIYADLFQFRAINFQQEKTDKIMNEIAACDWSSHDVGIQNLRNIGLFGACCIQKKFGGMELSLTEFLYILSHKSVLPYSQTLINHLALCALAIQSYGTDQQKQYYLPKMATGEIIGAYCAQEVNKSDESNSNPFKIRCTAANPLYDNTSTDEVNAIDFELTGKKSRVLNAKYANVLVVLGRTVDSVFEGARERTSLFIVDPNSPGVKISSEKYNQCCTNLADVEFDKVHVTEDDLIGKIHNADQVFEVLCGSISCQFSSILCGVARCMVQEMSMSENAVLSVKQSTRDLYTMESMLYYTSRMIDAQKNTGRIEFESDLVKKFCIEGFIRIMDRYKQILEPKSANISLASTWYWPLVSDIIAVGTNGYNIKDETDYTRSIQYFQIGEMILREIFTDIDILIHAVQEDGLGKTFRRRNKEKKMMSSVRNVLPGAEPNADGKFWFKKEAIFITKQISHFRQSGALMNRNQPKLKTSEFLKNLHGNIGLHLYALFCVIARANTGKTPVDKQIASEVLPELIANIDITWQHMPFIENNLHLFRANATCQGIEKENGGYVLKDVFDSRRNVYDNSPIKFKV